MKNRLGKTAAVIGAVLALSVSARGEIIITEVMSNSDHGGGPGNGDWFEVFNNGAASIDLTGFSWDDESAEPALQVFPGIVLDPGATLLVVNESAGNIADWQAMWNLPGNALVQDNSIDFAGLDADGDAIHIFDASDVEVASVTFGDSEGGGKSFEFDNTGASLDFSVAGENGAYVALNDGDGGDGIDVASPGVVVPEPSTLGLLGLALCAVLWRAVRRRCSR